MKKALKIAGGALGALVLLAVVYLALAPSPIDAAPWTPPPAPLLEGPLAPNEILARAEAIGVGQLPGPEDVELDAEGNIYTGLADGRIVRIRKDTGAIETVRSTGGRPLGLRFGKEGVLYVADTDKGLLSIDREGRISVLATEAEGRGVALQVDAAEPIAIPCDPDQIRQVVLNLVLNALQATPRGGEVGVTVRAQGGGASIAVRDNGVGIPEELRDRLFEPFTSRRDGGIGLGLAIVRRIVAEHGGSIEAGDNAPKGTRFTIELPV